MSNKFLARTVACVALVISVGATTSACSSTSTPATTTILAPNPPLPGDVNPTPFRYQELAALGNIQLAVANIKGNVANVDDKSEHDIVVTVLVRNGALTDMQVRPESFLLYTSDLRGVAPTNNPFTEPYKSDTRHTVDLVFHVDAKLLGVALVFNSQGYGDRVMSGQFLLDPNISFATS